MIPFTETPGSTLTPVLATGPTLDHATRPPRHAPETLRCSSTADFLAALPVLAGFTAENSLFIVCFQGSRGGNVIRIDLPPTDSPKATADFLNCVISLLKDTGAGAERPAMVITTCLSFAETNDVPRGRLAQQLKRRFRREGWRLRELAVIASDGWCGLLGESTKNARPLSEISQSPIAAKAQTHSRSVTDLATIGRLPQPDPLRSMAVQSQLHELQQRRLARSTHPACGMPGSERSLLRIRQAASVADACFKTVPGANVWASEPTSISHERERQAARPGVSERLLAKLIDTAGHQSGWLVCVLTALTRAEFVIDISHETSADRFTDIRLESEPGAKPGTREAWNIHHLLVSLAHEMPPHRRLRTVIAVAEDAIVHAPPESRPPLFAMLAWAWWAVGMQSVAARIAAEGLETAPDHDLLLMVRRLCETPPAAHLLGLREELARAA